MNDSPSLPTKRRRRKPVSTDFEVPRSLVEERLLQQAIENSKLDTHREGPSTLNIPIGPTFFPTIEEFQGNPLHYINKIRPTAEKYGICKIVPPSGWDPPFSVDMNSKKEFQTKEQLLHRIQEGISFGDGKDYCVSEYMKMAQAKLKSWAEKNGYGTDGVGTKKLTPEVLEQYYWDTVEINSEDFTVEYGNDVDSVEFGSGFPCSERGRCFVKNNSKSPSKDKDLSEPQFGTEEFYKESYWNLNNIPNCPDSILQHVKVGINGINVPWMYFGNLFSTFCWHNEDNYLYSINYHHWGAPKQWYGVPGTKKDAEGLEKVFKSFLSLKMQDVPDLLHHITTMFSPRLLQSAGVPVYKLCQHPGEFVVTFPRSFHGGFSMGPNAGEAVNFATYDWISHGADANERYRMFKRPAVFSHDRLAFTMANHVDELNSPLTCKLLVAELERIVNEECEQRSMLFKTGVRDVSEYINLPVNKVDQLDEDSANYDDKRLCHACKHICFFSCVACECSRSKVSCLRHSHFMCRCSAEKRYLMIWSTEKEMKETLTQVKKRLKYLQGNIIDLSGDDDVTETVGTKRELKKISNVVPGAAKDAENHRGYYMDVSESSPLFQLAHTGQRLSSQHKKPSNLVRYVTVDSSTSAVSGQYVEPSKKEKFVSDYANTSSISGQYAEPSKINHVNVVKDATNPYNESSEISI
mmetsp:Transcript_10156/g.12872  ORF Transcript_10156/g.12872 Transcript_10156/m.12872 type:complete len:692 (-) Transcript_10156:313-2388(-)